MPEKHRKTAPVHSLHTIDFSEEEVNEDLGEYISVYDKEKTDDEEETDGKKISESKKKLFGKAKMKDDNDKKEKNDIE